jgi:hypothetical protein
MANPKHLVKLHEGVGAWNKWRRVNPALQPDLSGTRLHNIDLRKANFTKTNFFGADLSEADLSEAELCDASLQEVNLRDAQMNRSNLQRANLSRANLFATNLSNADLRLARLLLANLTYASLNGANIQEARLYNVIFKSTKLNGTNFTNAKVADTVFADVDLGYVKGLETVKHSGPSTIGIDTIYRSQGKIPESFLRDAGVTEDFISYTRSLAGTVIHFYSCFLSYSSKDHIFSERLYADLQAKGIRCWFAPEDLKIGDRFRQRIDEAIRIYDKLLVVLSKDSIQSSWVEEEVEGALEKERQQQGKLALFPIRLDDAVMKTEQAWAANLRRMRHIADFTKWKDPAYRTAFKRLVRDLEGKELAKALERTS